MGIFDLIANTIEGVVQTSVNTGKAAVGVVIAAADGGDTMEEGIEGIREGLEKIGKSGDPKNGK